MVESKKTAQKAMPASKKAQTVKMRRGNTLANVHVDEVANYAKGDWKEVK